jgi:aspartyl-tRNA(Asn)/glutamyl-tRNA(Gln) amidotransferase subunit B
VRISRIHLEEDAGKLLHDRIPARTAIDLNRCGIPLLEVVTEPDLRSARDAADAARQLQLLMRYAEISSCDMELGELRIDANVSVGGETGRTEIKNINSFSQLERAIDAEIARQQGTIARGSHVANDTLTWDADAGEIRVMRSKEQRAEYRYFAEPDMPPLVLDDALIARARAGIPEAPAARALRFRDALTLPESSARSLAATRELADYFEAVIDAGASPHAAAAWTLTDALAWCNANGTDMTRYPVTAGQLAEIARRAEQGRITREGGRRILAVLEAGAGDVDEIVQRLELTVASDADALMRHIDEVLTAEAPLVARYRNGEQNLFTFLMGRLMQRAGSSVDPRVAAESLRTRLGR